MIPEKPRVQCIGDVRVGARAVTFIGVDHREEIQIAGEAYAVVGAVDGGNPLLGVGGRLPEAGCGRVIRVGDREIFLTAGQRGEEDGYAE